MNADSRSAASSVKTRMKEKEEKEKWKAPAKSVIYFRTFTRIRNSFFFIH